MGKKMIDFETRRAENQRQGGLKSKATQSSGKKLKSVFNFLTYSRETWFSFSYEEVLELIGLISPLNKIEQDK